MFVMAQGVHCGAKNCTVLFLQ